MQVEPYGKLVSSIYQASLSEIGWNSVLEGLADATGGMVAAMVFHDFALKESWILAPRTDPDIMERYAQYYWKHNIMAQHAKHVAPGIVMTPGETVGLDRLEQSEFYREWWHSQEIGFGVMIANLFSSEDAQAMVNVGKARPEDSFANSEKALFREILPHLIRGVEIYRRLQIAAIKPDFAAGSNMPLGFAVVDRAGRILDVGERTLRILESCGCLRSHHSPDAIGTQDGRLKALIRSCAEPVLGEPCGGVTMATTPDGDQVKIVVSPCPDECLNHTVLAGHRPAAILLISNRATDPLHVGGLLHDQFGLTPAEVSVALEVAKGKGRQLVADQLGLQMTTVRTHLTAIFAKTGVSRQAELARLVADLT